MRILLISQFAGSPEHGMVHANYYLAREWINQGHDVEVVCASFSHLRIHNPNVMGLWKKVFIKSVPYTFLRCLKHPAENRYLRAANLAIFPTMLSFFLLSRIYKKYDCVICVVPNPLNFIPILIFSKIRGVRIILEVRDIWPLSLQKLGNYNDGLFINTLKFVENVAYRYSDKVVTVLGQSKDYMVAKGLNPKKFTHIPNGVNTEESVADEAPMTKFYTNLEKIVSDSESFYVGYAGKLGTSNGVGIMIEIMDKMTDKNVILCLCGDGEEKKYYEQEVTKKNLGSRVHFLGSVPQNHVQGVLSRFDCLLACVSKSNLYEHGISLTKLNDYMLAAKPIVYSADDFNSPVQEAQAGFTCEAENINQCVQRLIDLKNMTEEQRGHIGNKGKSWILNNRSFENLAAVYLEEITESL